MFRYVIYAIGLTALAIVLWPAILRGIKAVKKASTTTMPEEKPKDPPPPDPPPM